MRLPEMDARMTFPSFDKNARLKGLLILFYWRRLKRLREPNCQSTANCVVVSGIGLFYPAAILK
jgi:hypothetical protein